MPSYAYIDVSRKQEFIYKNFRLKDNLYNSFIIKAVTEKLTDGEEPPFEALEGMIYLEKYLAENCQEQYCFEYSGGGNSIIRFQTQEQLNCFVKGYSFEILKAYPDLELYISSVDESEIKTGLQNNDKDRQIRELLIEKIDRLKDRRQSRFKRWTYGIEKFDKNGKTQIKAVEKDLDKRKSIAKDHMFRKFISGLNDCNVKVISKLQEYKKQDDIEGKSYIGVISIDGNKMGDMVNKINSFSSIY